MTARWREENLIARIKAIKEKAMGGGEAPAPAPHRGDGAVPSLPHHPTKGQRV